MLKVIHYCLQMYLKTLEISVLKYINLILLIFVFTGIKVKTKVKLELLTDIDMLLMVEKGIRGGICQAVDRCPEVNNKYMKNYNKYIISSYLMYLDANILYEWAMSQILLVNGFNWVKDLPRFNERFIKNYDENSDIGYFLEVDIDYPKELFNIHKD